MDPRFLLHHAPGLRAGLIRTLFSPAPVVAVPLCGAELRGQAAWAVAQAAAAFGANLLLSAAGLAAPAAGTGGVPALYPTQAEAEKAAKLHFNCTGAHRMGNQWMPCAKHGGSEGSSPAH